MFLMGLYDNPIKITETQKIESPIKINRWAIVIAFIMYGYGFRTFLYMITNPKSIVIWTLIAFYIVGILFIVISIVHMTLKRRELLKQLNEFIE